MTTKYGTAVGAAIFAFILILLPAVAATTITEREKRDCQTDYHKYCSEYGLGTEALRACMSRNIKKITNACVGALIDAGEMSQTQAYKLRQKTATVKTVKHSTHKKVAHKTSKKKH
ncbi:MAG TPA: hypothetical protein VGN85_01380 [Methyloceanibacter sp.]|jgi:hypothetical protein|nr:hypothetical protein [Methyloceanibacter sp.]